MDKGIRPFCAAKFDELNVQRQAGTINNTAFRKSVMCACMEQFNISLASAATHYNHAFQAVKKAKPEQVVNLGRPDDKKGGRKPKAKPELVGPVQPTTALTAAEVEGGATPPKEPDTGETAPEQTVFTVKKKSDDSVVAENLSFEDAKALVEKAAAAKKAKLYWV